MVPQGFIIVMILVKNLPYGVLSNCGICDDELEDELPTLQAAWIEVRSKVLSSIL